MVSKLLPNEPNLAESTYGYHMIASEKEWATEQMRRASPLDDEVERDGRRLSQPAERWMKGVELILGRRESLVSAPYSTDHSSR